MVLQHAKSGVVIVRQHRADLDFMEADRVVPLSKLLPAFARLDRQLQELTGHDMDLNQDLAFEQSASGYFLYGGPEPQPLPDFTSLHEAWIGLHQRWHSLIGWVGMIHIDWFNHMGDVHKATNQFASPWDSNEALEKRQRELSRDFELWTLGLQKLRERLGRLSAREEAIYALLKCHTLLAENVLATASLPREYLWDNYRDQFAGIVKLCRTVVEQETAELKATRDSLPALIVQHRYAPAQFRPTPETTGNPLTFELGIIMILLHVVTKCRHAQVRLDAIQLLENYPRLEGLWDGALIAQTGRAIDGLEREGESLEAAAAKNAPASDIPLARRVIDLRANMHLNSRSGDLIMYTHRRSWEDGAVAHAVTLRW